MVHDARPVDEDRRGLVAAVVIYALTAAQLAVATFVPGLPQFEGKAFGARLIAYPLVMAALPAVSWVAAGWATRPWERWAGSSRHSSSAE